jgi:hypothetical protein
MRRDIEVPDLEDFRESVDALGRNRNSTIIKTLYLTASRCNEFLTKISPSDLGRTEALGKLVICDIKKIIVPNIQYKGKEKIEAITCKPRLGVQPKKDVVPILLLKIPVLKRRKREKEPKQVKRQKFKNVAIPCIMDFEPWCADLLYWIRDHDGKLCFDLTRQSVFKIIKRELGYHPDHLRQIRVSHLVDYYGFPGEQIPLVTGWSMKTGYGILGQKVSPMVNIYLHSQWKEYIRKLLVSLDVIKSARYS